MFLDVPAGTVAGSIAAVPYLQQLTADILFKSVHYRRTTVSSLIVDQTVQHLVQQHATL